MAWVIEVNQSSLPLSEQMSYLFIKRVALAALSRVKRRSGRLSIGFVTPREMRKLNRHYRGRDKITDVISLPLGDDKKTIAHETYWGEVIVCPRVARKQARLFGNTEREEIARLIIHGILHIAGYDHKTSREARSMFLLADNILKKVS